MTFTKQMSRGKGKTCFLRVQAFRDSSNVCFFFCLFFCSAVNWNLESSLKIFHSHGVYKTAWVTVIVIEIDLMCIELTVERPEFI